MDIIFSFKHFDLKNVLAISHNLVSKLSPQTEEYDGFWPKGPFIPSAKGTAMTTFNLSAPLKV